MSLGNSKGISNEVYKSKSKQLHLQTLKFTNSLGIYPLMTLPENMLKMPLKIKKCINEASRYVKRKFVDTNYCNGTF